MLHIDGVTNFIGPSNLTTGLTRGKNEHGNYNDDPYHKDALGYEKHNGVAWTAS